MYHQIKRSLNIGVSVNGICLVFSSFSFGVFFHIFLIQTIDIGNFLNQGNVEMNVDWQWQPPAKEARTLACDIEEALTELTSTSQDVAGLLNSRIRILCLVVTTAKYHTERAKNVKKTWGKRCDQLVFVSDLQDDKLGALNLSSHDDWDHLWSKTREGFRWAYDNHLDDFDWFLKADDDTFVIMENLKALLAEFNPNDGVSLGHEYHKGWQKHPTYRFAGGSGYVLSRKAVQRLVEEAFFKPKYCGLPDKVVHEDSEIASCLESVGIFSTNTLDNVGRQRFLPLNPSTHLVVGSFHPKKYAIRHQDKYPFKEGEECCSSVAISFHYIEPSEMLYLEYFIYRMHIFGRNVFSQGEPFRVASQRSFALIEQTLVKNGYQSNHKTSQGGLKTSPTTQTRKLSMKAYNIRRLIKGNEMNDETTRKSKST